MHKRLALAALLVAAAGWARQATVTLLATTDLHGNIYPVDYFTGRPAERGLAKIATIVQAIRRETPNTLLIDCGDTIQGTPLEAVYQSYVSAGELPPKLEFTGEPLSRDPMMAAMNSLGYQAMVVGNHEFNFGLETIERARADAKFPWLSANIAVEPGVPVRPFALYMVARIDGIKIAIIGVTTPAIPNWEKPENYAGYRFLNPKNAVASAVAELRRKERPDIIVVAAHMGLGRNPSGSELPNENAAFAIASGVPGVDAMVIGHTHQQIAAEKVGDVLVVQPKNWGMSLARLDFTLESGADGRWKLTGKRSALLPVSAEVPADPGILKIAKPYHDLTERYLNTPVAESTAELDGRLGRIEDNALVDAVHAVQMHYAKADVSFTALFNPRVRVPAGPVTVRQIAALYIYENELYAVEGTGRMVKEALENAARYFSPCPDPACSHGPLINSRMPGFNYDMAQGVNYEIDLTKPAGSRILNLRRNGKPLRPDEKLRIAVNNYRAGGSGGYDMFRSAKVLWRSSEDIRDLIIRYYTEHKRLPAKPDGNWRIVPAQAIQVLEQEAIQDASRAGSQ